MNRENFHHISELKQPYKTIAADITAILRIDVEYFTASTRGARRSGNLRVGSNSRLRIRVHNLHKLGCYSRGELELKSKFKELSREKVRASDL